MSRCFVIQPFDSGDFDERYNDVLKPAIEKAGLEPYRIDNDLGADVLISAIESEIAASTICLADISTDNPNVWYELGYAFAARRPVIMICEEKRGKLPFDIAHRRVIHYRSGSRRHFDKLEEEIFQSIERRLSDTSTESTYGNFQDGETPISEKLTHNEILLLSSLVEETAIPERTMPLYSLQRETLRVGLTAVGFGIALRELTDKGFIETKEEQDYNESYQAAIISPYGWKLVSDNMPLFESREKINSQIRANGAPAIPDNLDDDIPF